MADDQEEFTTEDFLGAVKFYVNKRHPGSFDPTSYGEAIIGNEVAFIRVKWLEGAWQVWDICDGFNPIDLLPAYIPIDKVVEFRNWVQIQREMAEDQGRKDGLEEGVALQQRKLAALCGYNPNKFVLRSEIEE